MRPLKYFAFSALASMTLSSSLALSGCSDGSETSAPATTSPLPGTVTGTTITSGTVTAVASLTTGATGTSGTSSSSTGTLTSSVGGATGTHSGTESSVGGAGGADGSATGTTGSEDIETLEDGSPLLLSQTGLYLADMVTLAEGVRPFEPRFMLWSDDASKKRWIWLPEAAPIDTSDMDYWEFPAGTRVFKEFSRDGVRVETRMMTKRERGGWQRVAYQWREDQAEADAVPAGVPNASGTEHDIPTQEDCGTCHFRTPDKLLGFSAIQLSWDNPDPDAWTLARLAEAGKLTTAPPAIELPGSESEQAALGYMHANCGHCHNPTSSVTTRVTVDFWLSTDRLATVEETPTYSSSVCKNIELEEGGVPGVEKIIDPGVPENSAVFRRMDSRGEQYSMPPLGTELVDMTGRQAVEAWIVSLDGVACE